MKCLTLAAGLVGAGVLAESSSAQAKVVVAGALADAVLAISDGALHKDQMRIFARAAFCCSGGFPSIIWSCLLRLSAMGPGAVITEKLHSSACTLTLGMLSV